MPVSPPSLESRRLIPAYLTEGIPVAWRCGFCGKLFCVTLDKITETKTKETAQEIEAEFSAHSCFAQLVRVTSQGR